VKSQKTEFLRSDLACEGGVAGKVRDERSFKHTISGVNVTEHFLEENGKDYRYSTVDIGQIRFADEGRYESCVSVLSDELLSFIDRAVPSVRGKDLRILVAGLGNRHIIADALGPLTVEKLTVTSHIPEREVIFGTDSCCELCSVEPGVLGQTGIEAAAQIKGIAAEVNPHVIVAVDALAARSISRLATTVQISDRGINPGSGIGNRRMSVDRDTVGVPVIAMGVPTVVDSSTLVWDALERAGIEKDLPALRDVLESGRSFFVSPKESDIIIEEISAFLATVIHRVIGL